MLIRLVSYRRMPSAGAALGGNKWRDRYETVPFYPPAAGATPRATDAVFGG